MNDQTHTFTSRHGTLIVKPDGITVRRTWKQALQHGRLLNREQTIPFSSLQDMKHKQTGTQNGYLQFITKQGTADRTPLNRKATIQFGAVEAHHFRQAQKLIEQQLSQRQSINRGMADNQQPVDPAPHVNTAGLPFRRP